MAEQDQPLGHNRRVLQADSIAIGLVGAGAPFLSVFLVRIGASGTQVGLLTALPGIAGAALAIPIGRWLQRQRNIVPWYSVARLIAQSVYAVIGLAALVSPRPWLVAVVLVLWALSTVPNTVGVVAFPIVMDGAAGPEGRYELLSRRWSIVGFVTAVVVALAGSTLDFVDFPLNYSLFFAVVSVGGVASYWFAHRICIPDQAPITAEGNLSALNRARGLIEVLKPSSTFVRYEARAFVTTASVGILTPLLPLFYVEEIHASNQWIGIIAAAQSAGALFGYLTARRVARWRDRRMVLMPALVSAALIPLALALNREESLAAVLACANGMAAAAVSLALFDELMQRVPQRLGVTFSAVDQSAQNLALTAGPIVGGILATTIGIRAALVAAAITALVGCLLFAIDRRTAGTAVVA